MADTKLEPYPERHIGDLMRAMRLPLAAHLPAVTYRLGLRADGNLA